MRVIAGTVKGRKLKSLKGMKTRPTLDYVKEAVFNVLGSRVLDAAFLDLFAGTGAIGIESLSRGAKICYFNDKERSAKGLIEQNLQDCRLQDKSRVYCLDALRFVRYIKNKAIQFDLVYIDPPYETNLHEQIMRELAESGVLRNNALVIVETDSKKDMPAACSRLSLLRSNRYGDTMIWYYQYI